MNINQEQKKKPLIVKRLDWPSLSFKFVCFFVCLFDAIAIQVNINTNGFVSIVPFES